LVSLLQSSGFHLLDAQQMTNHLASLGCRAVSRTRFLMMLSDLITVPCLFPRTFPET
jgi:Leu/Phe-tRNA-protein transferase